MLKSAKDLHTMNSNNDKSPPSLVLNAVALRTDWNAPVRVGRLKYDDRNALDQLRRELGTPKFRSSTLDFTPSRVPPGRQINDLDS